MYTDVDERFEMTFQMERQSFLGVVCLHCKAPIPVPAIVQEFQMTPLQEAGASRNKSAVFNLRCSLCHKEKPYRTSEIVNFEGTPEPVAPFAQPATMRSFPLGGMTRIAKA